MVMERIKEKIMLELWAASKIQALFRGMVGRLLFDQKVLEKKGIWKELFDEEKKKRFFYNKLTGEIRWRMPQDLLDLIPRPKCDNCSFYEAGVECSFCNEFFCSQCWDQVRRVKCRIMTTNMAMTISMTLSLTLTLIIVPKSYISYINRKDNHIDNRNSNRNYDLNPNYASESKP
jgi:hypothetical protein